MSEEEGKEGREEEEGEQGKGRGEKKRREILKSMKGGKG